jgi:hypothetical protein
VEAAHEAWRPLGELLLEQGLLTKEELEHARAVQKESGRMLGAVLVERGYLSAPAVAIALAAQYGVEFTTERGFGTGLWAEIDRRHRAGREGGDNVVRLETKPAALEAVPDLEPALGQLQAENRRLHEEIERLEAELRKPTAAEEPERHSSHVVFVPAANGYQLFERDGAPPAVGEELALGDTRRFVVTKLGRAPLPGGRLPCAFLALR